MIDCNRLLDVGILNARNQPIMVTTATANRAIERAPESGPTPVQLLGPIHEDWQLDLPLVLLVDREADGWFAVGDGEFCVYGDGPTARDAICAYIVSLIDHYEFLSREVRANPLAVAQWQHMRRYLRPRRTEQ